MLLHSPLGGTPLFFCTTPGPPPLGGEPAHLPVRIITAAVSKIRRLSPRCGRSTGLPFRSPAFFAGTTPNSQERTGIDQAVSRGKLSAAQDGMADRIGNLPKPPAKLAKVPPRGGTSNAAPSRKLFRRRSPAPWMAMAALVWWDSRATAAGKDHGCVRHHTHTRSCLLESSSVANACSR